MNNNNINIWINGAKGKMGSELISYLAESKNIIITGIISPEDSGTFIQVQGAALEFTNNLDTLKSKCVLPDVLVDFTNAQAAYDAALFCASNNIHFVSGTTGLVKEQKEQITEVFSESQTNAIIASNFSLGAVLMMELSAKAAPFFSEIEIIETHHTRKLDSPSGTALSTAALINDARKEAKVPSGEIPMHSLRLSGAIAHQQVHLSSPGEILRIEHDANDRKCFMPGVVLSIEKVSKIDNVLYSITPLLFP